MYSRSWEGAARNAGMFIGGPFLYFTRDVLGTPTYPYPLHPSFTPSSTMFTNPLRSLWQTWKSLRLPWRRKFLAGEFSPVISFPLLEHLADVYQGTDLAGNKFWELKLGGSRPRRMLQPARKLHYGDVQVSPQWLQWLRYTRPHAPSIQEQQQDLLRQARMKELARIADERWASKPSMLDGPEMQKPAPPTKIKDSGGYPPPSPLIEGKGMPGRLPGEDWRPQAWTPNPDPPAPKR